MKIYYNTTNQCLVDEFNCQVNTKPILFFGEKPIWQLQLYHGEVGLEPQKANVSHIVSWSSAVDADWDHSSEPMCRTPSGIDISASSEGLLGIPMNANTLSFQNKLATKRKCEGFWEIRGYDSTGSVVMVIIMTIICHNAIDHDGGVQLDEPEGSTASKAWVESILSGKADINKVYTREETDKKINAKADAENVYTKEEIDSMLGNIEQQLAEI